MPTSPNARTSAATTRAASIRQTASTAAAGRSAAGDLLTQRPLRLDDLGAHQTLEVLGLEHRPDLDLRPAAERRAPEPLDRLVDRGDLPDPVARHQLLGLGERAVDHGRAPVAEPHPLAVRTRPQ